MLMYSIFSTYMNDQSPRFGAQAGSFFDHAFNFISFMRDFIDDVIIRVRWKDG